mmetsp:Transcript_10650/g.17900  ORF Transcript_10650/g.17900 Transcript_10650/m.17900 type:complete len:83 (+) Transcript_10650:841-1089(+)
MTLSHLSDLFSAFSFEITNNMKVHTIKNSHKQASNFIHLGVSLFRKLHEYKTAEGMVSEFAPYSGLDPEKTLYLVQAFENLA